MITQHFEARAHVFLIGGEKFLPCALLRRFSIINRPRGHDLLALQICIPLFSAFKLLVRQNYIEYHLRCQSLRKRT